MPDRQMVARERVARAMTALGGFDSAAGSIAPMGESWSQSSPSS